MRSKADILNPSKFVKEDAAQIEQMMTSGGWDKLAVYWCIAREKIITEGKRAKLEKDKNYYWDLLIGFDRATLMAENIVKQAHLKNDLVMETEGE